MISGLREISIACRESYSRPHNKTKGKWVNQLLQAQYIRNIENVPQSLSRLSYQRIGFLDESLTENTLSRKNAAMLDFPIEPRRDEKPTEAENRTYTEAAV